MQCGVLGIKNSSEFRGMTHHWILSFHQCSIMDPQAKIQRQDFSMLRIDNHIVGPQRAEVKFSNTSLLPMCNVVKMSSSLRQ